MKKVGLTVSGGCAAGTLRSSGAPTLLPRPGASREEPSPDRASRSTHAVKLPTIAPLTRLEAKAARFALPPIRETLQTMPEDPATRGFVQAAVDELEAALAEYEARGWLRWLVPPPAEHKTRLRPWLFENIGYAEARAAELKGP